MKTLIKLSALLLVFPSPVFASVVSYSFTAQVDSVVSTGLVNPGDVIHGVFSYDSSVPLAGPTSSNFYTAQQDRELFGLSLTAGGADVLDDDAFYYNSGVTTDFAGTPTGAHMFSIATINISSGWPGIGVSVNFLLSDSTGSVFPDNTLPETLDLSDFDSSYLVISRTADSQLNWRINSSITSLQPSPIPVPPAIVLLGSGLLFIVRFAGKNNSV